MATIKEINHDSSTTIGDFYGTVSNGNLAVTTASALENSVNGVDADYSTGGGQMFLRESFSFSTNDFRWRFIVKLDNLTNNNSGTELFDATLESGSNNEIFKIIITGNAGDSGYTILAKWKTDGKGGGLQDLGSATAIPSTGEVCIEMRAIKETGAGNDGEVELFIDGVSVASTTTADNSTVFATIAQTQITFEAADTDITGNLFYDEWLLDDDNTTEIGCAAFSGYDLVLGGGQP